MAEGVILLEDANCRLDLDSAVWGRLQLVEAALHWLHTNGYSPSSRPPTILSRSYQQPHTIRAICRDSNLRSSLTVERTSRDSIASWSDGSRPQTWLGGASEEAFCPDEPWRPPTYTHLRFSTPEDLAVWMTELMSGLPASSWSPEVFFRTGETVSPDTPCVCVLEVASVPPDRRAEDLLEACLLLLTRQPGWFDVYNSLLGGPQIHGPRLGQPEAKT
ncbi:unnamed protein product, partial [Protopolystoma xenopodis]